MSASKLMTTIEKLATEFADELLHALGTASFTELSAELGRSAGRPAAKSAARAPAAKRGRRGGGGGDASASIDRVVSTLRSAGATGMRSEELRKRMGLERVEMMRTIAAALAAKRIRKTGQKRATTYYAR